MDIAATLFIRVVEDVEGGVMPTNTDISDSDTALRPSPNFDFILIWEVYYVNGFGRTISHRLKNHILVRIRMNIKSQEWNLFPAGQRNNIIIKRLTNLTFKTPPDVRVDEWCLLFVFLAFEPLFNTFQMNMFYGACTTARRYNRITRLLFRKTNPAANFFVSTFIFMGWLLFIVDCVICSTSWAINNIQTNAICIRLTSESIEAQYFLLIYMWVDGVHVGLNIRRLAYYSRFTSESSWASILINLITTSSILIISLIVWMILGRFSVLGFIRILWTIIIVFYMEFTQSEPDSSKFNNITLS